MAINDKELIDGEIPPTFVSAEEELEAMLQRSFSGNSNDPQASNDAVAPNEVEDSDYTKEEERQDLLMALFGDDFPGASEDTVDDEDAWVSWARRLWSSRSAAMQTHLHLVERNRLFRAGRQWISSGSGAGSWRVPGRPKDTARVVFNMVDKALDQRLQIINDQKPGFAVSPQTIDPVDKRKAAAAKVALEYQYEQQGMIAMGRESSFWSQTDGVSFWHIFWNPDLGPEDERMTDEGMPATPLGDVGSETVRTEQVRVAPNATSTRKPNWVVIREVIPTSEAAHRYGVKGMEASGTNSNIGSSADGTDGLSDWVLSETTVGEGQRLRDEETVERFTVYLAPQPDVIPEGLHLIVVGNSVVYGPAPLLWGMIPLVRVSDGSTDPSYFPRPTMEQWIDHQVRVNALLSKWVENVRVNAGGRFLTRPNAISTETFLGGVTSMIEVRGAGPMAESIQPVNGFSVGTDVKEALALEMAAFENASGWNQVSRGQVTGESGRAIIANREQLERIFAPPVTALAHAYTEWARITLAAMKWGYDVPRTMGVVGTGRPDLAKSLQSTDFDGAMDIRVEPTTMMPMPMSFRLYLLDNWLATGVIDQAEYRRRQQFAMAQDIQTPDMDQEARAKRIADAIRSNETVPEMRWQDDEAIHQDVLEREIILQDDLPQEMVAAAQERWLALANQSAQKNGAMVPPEAVQGGAPGAPSPETGGAASAPPLPPQTVPLSGGNPAMGSASIAQQSAMGVSDAEILARQADAAALQ